jgi:hypothetical protein
MQTKKSHLKININKDDSSLNDFLYLWDIFKSRPNKVLIHGTFLFTETENYLNEFEIENKFTEIICVESDDIVNDKVLVKCNDTVFVSYIAVDKITENAIISDITIYYKSKEDTDLVNDVIKNISEFQLVEEAESGHNLNAITLSSNTLELEQLISDDIDVQNIEDYYSKQTFKSLNKWQKKSKKQKTGLTIFYGKRGTGKSSTIKYLSTVVQRPLIFIPNNLVDLTINGSDFIKFLKKHKSPILVLDDCEMIFNEFFTKSNLIANNLLQLVDGLMSSKLNISIITIFNVEDKNEIDHNLMDCNNLLDIIEFTDLSNSEANQLSELLGYKQKHKNDIRLLDLLTNNKSTNKKRLGF